MAQPLRHGAALFSQQGHRDAEEHRKDDEGQDMAPGDHQGKIADGEGVDDLVPHAHDGGSRFCLRPTQLNGGVYAEDPCDGKHINSCDGGGDHEYTDGQGQHLPHPSGVTDPGDGAGDGEEDQRHQQNE